MTAAGVKTYCLKHYIEVSRSEPACVTYTSAMLGFVSCLTYAFRQLALHPSSGE
jgi:hypothetical protein